MRTRYSVSAVLLLVFLCAYIYAQEKSDDVIKVDTSLVNIPVVVSDRDNRYLPGLTIDNFKVFQDGSEQKIEIFSNADAPLHVALALDTSRSTAAVLGKIKKAAKEFINDLGPDDRCMILSFDNNVEILSDLTSDKNQLDRAIKGARIGDDFGTVLQDAVYTIVNSKFHSVKGRKAIILLTDGKDFGSSVAKNDLFDRLTESDTVIYPIFYETGNNGLRALRQNQRFPGGGIGRGGKRGGMRRFPGGRFPDSGGGRGGNRPNFPGGGGNRRNKEEQGRLAIQFLEHLADITGGRFFKEQKANLNDAFQQIADEMKRQYVIGFYPTTDSTNGAVHHVKVLVDKPGTVVRSKSVYRTQTK